MGSSLARRRIRLLGGIAFHLFIFAGLLPQPAAAQASPSAALTTHEVSFPNVQWANSFLAGQASSAAYLDHFADRQLELVKWGLSENEYYVGPRSTEVLFAEDRNRQFLFVAVRGTQELRDMLVDARVGRKSPSWESGVLLHNGFLDAADDVYVKVKDKIASTGPRTVILTGHSLGGAIGHIIGYRLDKDGVPFHSIITFGAPRTGNAEWAAKYNSRLSRRTHDFVNDEDPVPCLPSNLDRWVGLVGSHFHLKSNAMTVESDSCANFFGAEDLFPGLVENLTSFCDKIPRPVRRLMYVFAPNPCANAARVVDRGLRDVVITLLTTNFNQHALDRYLRNLRGAVAPSSLRHALFDRPARVNAFFTNGGVATELSNRIEEDGYTSTAFYRSAGKTFQIMLQAQSGGLRILEVDGLGVPIRVVSDRDMKTLRGAKIVGIYEPFSIPIPFVATPRFLVTLTAGTVIEVFRIEGNNTITTRTAQDEPLDYASSQPVCKPEFASNASYDGICALPSFYVYPGSVFNSLFEIPTFTADAAAIAPILNGYSNAIILYDRDQGVIRTRNLTASGGFGATTAPLSIRKGYDNMQFFKHKGVSRMMFVANDGRVAVTPVDVIGQPGAEVGQVALSSLMAVSYGWGDVTTYHMGDAGFALFNRPVDGARFVLGMRDDGLPVNFVSSGTDEPGWTIEAAFNTVSPTVPLLFSIRQ